MTSTVLQQPFGFGVPMTGNASAFANGLFDSLRFMMTPTPAVSEQLPITGPMEALEEAYEAAKQEALTNPDQVAPTSWALYEASLLLDMLPRGIDPPEPVIEPSGAIAWLWDSDKGFLVLAVVGQGLIERSAVIGGKKTVGRAPLAGTLSATDLDLLKHFRAAA